MTVEHPNLIFPIIFCSAGLSRRNGAQLSQVPCHGQVCTNHPQAICINDYCGGCFARFYDDSFDDITNQCGNVVSLFTRIRSFVI